MFKKYFFVTVLLLNNVLFAVDFVIGQHRETKVIQRLSEVSRVPSQGLPANKSLDNYKEYRDLDLVMQAIADSLFSESSSMVRVFNYSKKESFMHHIEYIIFRLPRLTKNRMIEFNSEGNIDYINNYSFYWQRKIYNKLDKYEKWVADYYHANNQSKIEYLYPYNSSNNAWAIKIDDKIHAIIWKKTELINPSGILSDPFLTVSSERVNDVIEILVNENDQIIAKCINGVVIGKDNK